MILVCLRQWADSGLKALILPSSSCGTGHYKSLEGNRHILVRKKKRNRHILHSSNELKTRLRFQLTSFSQVS
jgi:hypothetical protein